MSFKQEFNETIEILKLVLSEKKYKLISLISGLIFFGFLYYFLVSEVAGNSIWISVMMSGPEFITFSVTTILITSILSGILLSMLFFKFSVCHSISGKGIFGFVGSGIGAFGVGCPTCGAFLFGLIGLPLALIYLPFKGLELQVLGILVLIVSIYLTGKSIRNVCKTKTPKKISFQKTFAHDLTSYLQKLFENNFL